MVDQCGCWLLCTFHGPNSVLKVTKDELFYTFSVMFYFLPALPPSPVNSETIHCAEQLHCDASPSRLCHLSFFYSVSAFSPDLSVSRSDGCVIEKSHCWMDSINCSGVVCFREKLVMMLWDCVKTNFCHLGGRCLFWRSSSAPDSKTSNPACQHENIKSQITLCASPLLL